MSKFPSRLEAASPERPFEEVREGHVLARIGDEDAGLRLALVFGVRIHPHVSRRQVTLANSEPIWKAAVVAIAGKCGPFLLDHEVGSVYLFLGKLI
jgi:hypothetical protein